jgi:ABC-type proline/glycine betaine transport system substrate-binding protein
MAPLNKLALFGLLAAGLAASASAANIYKYFDENGRTVYNSHMPPDLAKNGYSILNERGQVIEVVPRQLTPAEIAVRDAAEQRRLAEAEAARKQELADNLLVRTYKAPAEILAQRDVRVMRLDNRLTELARNLGRVDAEITRLTGLVDTARAEGAEPGEALVTRLTEQQAQSLGLQNEITVVEAEKQEEIDTAERNAQRLEELLGTAKQPATQ